MLRFNGDFDGAVREYAHCLELRKAFCKPSDRYEHDNDSVNADLACALTMTIHQFVTTYLTTDY
jgi:hypothetical protein